MFSKMRLKDWKSLLVSMYSILLFLQMMSRKFTIFTIQRVQQYRVLCKYYNSLEYKAAEDKIGEDKSVIPIQKNIIKHFCNIEIYAPDDVYKSDCLGWITLMPKADTDLRNLLKNDKLSFDERKKIAVSLMDANDYLNKIGITHCDLKPANILLKNGVPLITDFGLLMETSNRISYRQMGYSRKGSKYKDSKYLCKLLLSISKIKFLSKID